MERKDLRISAEPRLGMNKYGITPGVSSWTVDEHIRFLDAIEIFPKGPWESIREHIATRSLPQLLTHVKVYHKIQRAYAAALDSPPPASPPPASPASVSPPPAQLRPFHLTDEPTLAELAKLPVHESTEEPTTATAEPPPDPGEVEALDRHGTGSHSRKKMEALFIKYILLACVRLRIMAFAFTSEEVSDVYNI